MTVDLKSTKIVTTTAGPRVKPFTLEDFFAKEVGLMINSTHSH